jgi:Trk-type K+ transport system membrane component
MILLFLEPYKNPIDLLFEATSALGTVGLSRNLTFIANTK